VPSFTTQHPDLRATGPLTPVRITLSQPAEQAIRRASGNVPAPIEALALIDTGASGTVIREGIADRLGIVPVGVAQVQTAGHSVQCYEYLVTLAFQNKVVIQNAKVIQAPMQSQQQVECLIGRDVLQHGVLIYTGYINQFALSF
jgi:predicted aspartyl protease